MKKFIVLGLLLLFVTGCGCAKDTKTKTKDLEATMKEYASDFYEKNVKELVTGITEQEVTIATLKKLDYDTSVLKDPETGKLCSSDSYAIITIEDPSNLKDSDYTVKNYLTCGDYKTAK